MTTAKPNALRHAFKRLRKKIREVRARVNRRITNAKVIAVTGSSGKTTTVASLAHILSESGSVRSLFVSNGFRDAVHTLGHLSLTDAFVVLEQGTEAQGQLPKAAELIKPGHRNRHTCRNRALHGISNDRSCCGRERELRSDAACQRTSHFKFRRSALSRDGETHSCEMRALRS